MKGCLVSSINGISVRHSPEISLDTGEFSRWEWITPDLAEYYLSKNHPDNRTASTSSISYYSDQMRSKEWVPTHEGIAFDTNNHLVDGQQRLRAVIKSGCSQRFLVTRGLSASVLYAINRGRSRTLANSLQILGVTICGAKPGNRIIGIANAMMKGLHCGHWTRQSDVKVKSFIQQHSKAIEFAYETFYKHEQFCVLAGILARAFYHTDQETLSRFIDAYLDRVPLEDQKEHDRTARKLREMHLSGTLKAAGSNERLAAYRRCQLALRAWLDGRSLMIIRESFDDLFPLPTSA